MLDSIKIGKFIAELRNENKLTQKNLADKLNIHETTVSKWERGINVPDVYYLEELSKIFNVTEHEILNGERNYKKKKIDFEHHERILEVKNVSKKFKNKRIINNIDFEIYEGDIVGLIGPNGAGKTTLIKTILGFYKLNSGKVEVCGYDTKYDIEKALSKIGCIVENPDLYENISGKKNLKITSILNNINDKEYVNKIIKYVGLEERINDKVKKYSLGMKQRLGLANALIKKPKLLILDEPTNGLDPAGIKDLREIIKKISEEENISVLISSHILSEIENICDRILIINNGNIVRNFGIEKVKYRNISLEEEYFKIVEGDVDEDN